MKPSFVIDASATLPWCFLDEISAFTDALLDRAVSGDRAIVPPHWPIEVLNGVVKAKQRGRVVESTIQEFFRSLQSVNIVIDNRRTVDILGQVKRLSERHRLTAYDAAYLELAQRAELPLATLDSALQRAALAEGVPLL